MTATQAARTDVTRRRLLDAAFHEFYRQGFQAGSLTAIVDGAQVTKGALFHHFASKQALGYAVVDEMIVPLLSERWLAPLDGAADPITALQEAFERHVGTDIASGSWTLGCPMNNLAQEMSPLDAGFHARLGALYARWRATVADALERAQGSGAVRSDVDVQAAAALVVLSQIGIWSMGKHSQDPALMRQASDALCTYLDTLRPPRVGGHAAAR
jgi:AcrR family transcriptional regulator